MGHSRQRGQNLLRNRGVEQPCPCARCEHRVRAVGRLSVEPQTHHGSRRALKHEANAVALNPVTGVLIRKGHKEIHRHRGDRDTEKKAVERETEIGAGCHKQDRWQPPESKGEERGTVSPSKLRREPALQAPPPCQTSSLQSCERINGCFKPPSLQSFVRKLEHL